MSHFVLFGAHRHLGHSSTLLLLVQNHVPRQKSSGFCTLLLVPRVDCVARPLRFDSRLPSYKPTWLWASHPPARASISSSARWGSLFLPYDCHGIACGVPSTVRGTSAKLTDSVPSATAPRLSLRPHLRVPVSSQVKSGAYGCRGSLPCLYTRSSPSYQDAELSSNPPSLGWT